MESDKQQKSKIVIKDENKVQKLFVKLGVVSAIFVVLLIILIIIVSMLSKKRSILQSEIDSLKNASSIVQVQIRDIDNKAATAKNYIQVWEKDFIPYQKELKGINIDDVKKTVVEIANSNLFTNTVIEVSPVILAGQPLENASIRTYTTVVTVKFNAITDVNVYQFLDELKSNIGYFITIQEVTLKRVKRVDDDFLNTLSIGNIVTALEGEIKIRLYGLGENKVII